MNCQRCRHSSGLHKIQKVRHRFASKRRQKLKYRFSLNQSQKVRHVWLKTESKALTLVQFELGSKLQILFGFITFTASIYSEGGSFLLGTYFSTGDVVHIILSLKRTENGFNFILFFILIERNQSEDEFCCLSTRGT